jgi:KDO2-lipid IV(A) lauroyltransferase
MSSGKKIKNDIIYGLIRVVMSIIESLPRDMALKFAGVLGEMAAIIDSKERHLAEQNLRRAYGDAWSDEKIEMVARECFVQIARNAADVIRSQHWDESELADMVQEVIGMEHFDAAYTRGRGVVGVTGHIGNFELLAAWFSAVKKVRLSAIGRKLYDERLDELVVEHRERWGLENIPSDSPKRVLEALRNGRMLGVLMDLDSSRVAGYFVPFFGQPAKTAAGAIAIGRRTGSAVVPMALYRRPDDYYKIVVLPSFDIPCTDNKDDDIISALGQCNRALEELINIDPTQWAWIHNRWKSKPSSGPNINGGLPVVGPATDGEEIGLSNA